MDYWQKQTSDKPLFEDILWSRPESRQARGKLLIIGGNVHGFSAVGEAYQAAQGAGAGAIRVLLPDSLKKIVGIGGDYEFAPSTANSGGFSKQALDEWLLHAGWADMVLIAGDLGRNSETSVLLESFVAKYNGPLTLTKDAVEYFYQTPGSILERPNTLIVANLGQLQKLGTASKFETPFLLSMGLLLLVQALHDFSKLHQAVVVTKELGNIVVAHQGKVSSTKLTDDKELWQVETAAKSAVFWMQNLSKPYESVTSSLV